MVLSWKALGTAVGIDMAVVAGVFFVFNWLRRNKFTSDFYSAKRKLSIPFRFRPPRLPPKFFTWMVPVFTMPDERFAACAGFDALAYCRALKLMLLMSLYITVTTMVIVLPVNLTGHYVDRQPKPDSEACVSTQADPTNQVASATSPPPPSASDCASAVTSFDKTSMTNIDERTESNRLWAHCVALWIITLFVMKMLWDHYKESIRWRILYLSWTRKGDAGHTVLLQDIPGTTSGTIVGRIHDNLDGTLGRLLPASLKDKVHRAMDEGIDHTFGKVEENKVMDRLKEENRLFKDASYDVYTMGYPEADSTKSNEFVDAKERMASLRSVGSFGSASKRSGSEQFFEAQSAHGSFLSAHGTPPASSSYGPEIPFEQPKAALKKSDSYAEVQKVFPTNPPATVAGRRNLRNFESRPPPTDFETWQQAESAIRAGCSVKQLVQREFERDFGPDCVHHIATVKNEIKVGRLKAKYDRTFEQVEDMVDSWTQTLRRKKKVTRPKMSINVKNDESAEKRWGAGKHRLDSMEYKMWLLDDLQDKIRVEQRNAAAEETSAAFVTLHQRQLQSTVAIGMVSYNEGLWQTAPAPSPEEIIWRNVQWRGWERGLRALLGWGILVCIIIFFLPLVTLLQQVINLDQLASQGGVSWAASISNVPFIGPLIKGILPTLALKIFLVLVPIILRLSARFVEGKLSESMVDFGVGQKYYVFQIVVVFIFVTIIGAASTGVGGAPDCNGEPFQLNSALPIIDLLQSLGKCPSTVVNLLGRSIPQQASFYISYILTNATVAKGLAFLRIPGAVIFLFLSRLSGTKRQKKKTWSQQFVQYGTELPDHTITALLLLVFSVAQPFVALISVLYFIFVFFYTRYQLLYTQRERFQTGGLFWPVIFDQIYAGLLISLVGNAALFSIKNNPAALAAIIPLIIIAVLYRVAVARTFQRPMYNLSFHAAADLDRADRFYDWIKDTTPEEEEEMRVHDWDIENTRFGPVSERYRQPSLINNMAEHSRVLREAKDICAAAEAFNNGERPADEGGPFMLSDDDSDSHSTTTQATTTNTQGMPVLAVGQPVPARAL